MSQAGADPRTTDPALSDPGVSDPALSDPALPDPSSPDLGASVLDRGYLLANQQDEAGRRFEAMAELFDPVTLRHVDTLGIAAGWHCWEVGAGGPSIPRALVERVGHTGRVLATDLDVAWLTDSAPDPGFEIRQHDVTTEPPAGPFDLVHARLLLVHIPTRATAVAAMVRSLRPGGWVLIEDADPTLQPLSCLDEFGPEQELANRLRRGFRTLMAARGADLAFGRTLPRLLRDAGLVDVCADAYFPVGSPACTALELATIAQIRTRLVAAGLATEHDIERHLFNVSTGRLDLATAPMISAWGRVPSR